jgi:predicted outer membrane repeat protein
MFTNVAINNSNGAGLTMVNCGGMVNITGSTFTKNGIKTSTNIPGGGGISIELCYHLDCNSTSDLNATYYIQDCQFINNSASVGKFLPTHITSNKNYFTYGQGGGLFVNFVSNNNFLIVRNSYFEHNKAQRGGGLFVGFRTHTEGNNITVDNCTFLQNSCYQSDLPPGEKHSSGGAMGVIFYTNTKSSNFSITKSNFTRNTAYYGGGISMGTGSTYYPDKASTADGCNFNIQRSIFDGNNARIGAALDLYYRVAAEQLHHYSSVLTDISDTNFTRNGGVYHYSKQKAKGRTFATIYIVYIPVQFRGKIHIVNNTASGFGIEEATVGFKENALVNLTRNTAKIGGGMALIGRATVVLHENTTVIFHLNKASERGGAIFSTQSQERYTAYDYTCFIQYKSPDKSRDEAIGLHPTSWKASITFSNNTANSSNYEQNAIYASSVLPCVWPLSATSNLSYDISSTFCGWEGSWIFSGTNRSKCTDLIRTAPSNFTRNRYSVEVIPGKLITIPHFGVQDDYGHKMSSALYTVSNITVVKCKNRSIPVGEKNWPQDIGISVTDDGLLLTAAKNYSQNNCNLNILLQTADRKSITTKLNIKILRCPPGYKINKVSKSCQCQKNHNFNGLLSCNRSSFTSSIFAGNCMTLSKINIKGKLKKHFIVARCPYVVGNLKSLYVQLPPYDVHKGDPEDAFCQHFQRTGKLCGKCKEDLGLDVYSASFKCTKCKHIHVNWIKSIAASTVPTTLLFILCTIFHISITSAPINGYIFFSHVITMRLDVLTVRYLWEHMNDTHSLSRLLHVPYQLWTFDFPQILLRDVCLGKKFKVVDALALQYLSVLYPLLLVFIAIILIELHANNCKPLVWLWKPLCYLCIRFRHSWHIRTTVIDTFASFLLLSYSNLIGVSMSLLTPSKIITSDGQVVGRILNYDTSVEFFKPPHLKYGIFAIIILCTFGAIPPILLILYPFKWFQYMLNRCNLRGWRFLHVFVDAFQGSYKNGIKGYPERRYFAGVYFLFRIAINIIYLAVEDMINLHLTLTLTYMFFMLILMAQRPYKKNFYNILDGIFMSILVTTHAMTVYLFYHAVALNQIPQTAWYFTYAIQHIPTLYMILLVTYLVSFRMRCVKRFFLTHFSGRSLFFKNDRFNDENSPKSPLINYDWPSSSSLVIPSPSSPHAQTRNISDIPDRVENPHRYESLVDSWPYPQKSSLQDFSGVVSKDSKNIPDY